MPSQGDIVLIPIGCVNDRTLDRIRAALAELTKPNG
jgi:hypothetical protein